MVCGVADATKAPPVLLRPAPSQEGEKEREATEVFLSIQMRFENEWLCDALSRVLLCFSKCSPVEYLAAGGNNTSQAVVKALATEDDVLDT